VPHRWHLTSIDALYIIGESAVPFSTATKMGSTSFENKQVMKQCYAGPDFHGSWCAHGS
jgi:hypothetical protein